MLFPASCYEEVGRVSRLLLAKEIFLGAAESCTGGLLSALCTELSGSSQWFAGGVVSYDNSVKSGVLGVSPSLLAAHGAVSRETAELMAHGCLRALGVGCAVSITGIAGPGGGTPEKPIGTVWMAVVRGKPGESEESGDGRELSSRLIVSRRHFFSGNRADIRLEAVRHALALVEEALSS